MGGVLIRMKLSIIKNSMTGGRAAWMLVGAMLGLLFAAATIWLTLVDIPHQDVLGDLLACVFVMWMLGWLIGPLWGGSAVLRVEHFTLLPVPRRTLAMGLLAAAFVGITTAVTALGFVALVTYGARQGVVPALVAVPVAGLQLVFVVLLSRVAYGVFGVVAASRAGAAITGLLFAAMLVLTQSGWMIVVAIMYSDILTTGFSSAMSITLRASPSSWGIVAVDAAGRGDWPLAIAAPAGLVLLSVLLPLTFDARLLLPWAGPALALFAITSACNLYGQDGTAL